MNIACLIFGVLFTLIGFFFAIGKVHIFFNVWKKMPDEEKEKIKIVPLCINIGVLIFASGLLFLVSGIIQTFREKWFLISMIVWMVLAVIDAIFISKSKYFKNR